MYFIQRVDTKVTVIKSCLEGTCRYLWQVLDLLLFYFYYYFLSEILFRRRVLPTAAISVRFYYFTEGVHFANRIKAIAVRSHGQCTQTINLCSEKLLCLKSSSLRYTFIIITTIYGKGSYSLMNINISLLFCLSGFCFSNQSAFCIPLTKAIPKRADVRQATVRKIQAITRTA